MLGVVRFVGRVEWLDRGEEIQRGRGAFAFEFGGEGKTCGGERWWFVALTVTDGDGSRKAL